MRPIERTGKNILTRNCFQFVKRRYKGATVGLTKLEKSEINEPLNNVLNEERLSICCAREKQCITAV